MNIMWSSLQDVKNRIICQCYCQVGSSVPGQLLHSFQLCNRYGKLKVCIIIKCHIGKSQATKSYKVTGSENSTKWQALYYGKVSYWKFTSYDNLQSDRLCNPTKAQAL